MHEHEAFAELTEEVELIGLGRVQAHEDKPAGGLIGLGTSPVRMISSRVSSGCDGSAAAKSACV